MKAFVMLFPPALVLSLMLIPWLNAKPMPWWYAPLMVAPWLLISPWLASSIQRKAEAAVDVMVRGMAQVGSRK